MLEQNLNNSNTSSEIMKSTQTDRMGEEESGAGSDLGSLSKCP
jgi:hypothetical protein